VQLYGGCVLAEYKNFCVLGTSQLRYAFGAVVTPGMELPIGLVVKESGLRLPRTRLVDPHAAIRSIRRGKRMPPVLWWKKKKLRNKIMGSTTAPIFPRKAAPVSPAIPRSLKVF
jgi:hypothetical protein